MRFQCIAIQYSGAFRSFSHSVSLHLYVYVYDVWFVSCTEANKQAKTKLKNLMLSILYALNKHTAFHCHWWVAFHLYCVYARCCVSFYEFHVFLFGFCLSIHTQTHAHTCTQTQTPEYVFTLFLMRARLIFGHWFWIMLPCVCACMRMFILWSCVCMKLCVWLNFDLGPELKDFVCFFFSVRYATAHLMCVILINATLRMSWFGDVNQIYKTRENPMFIRKYSQNFIGDVCFMCFSFSLPVVFFSFVRKCCRRKFIDANKKQIVCYWFTDSVERII